MSLAPQSVKRVASAQAMIRLTVRECEPHMGLAAVRTEPALDPSLPSLPLPIPSQK